MSTCKTITITPTNMSNKTAEEIKHFITEQGFGIGSNLSVGAVVSLISEFQKQFSNAGYSREQVEQLLIQQRRICSEYAKLEYYHVNNFSDVGVEVDRESIFNATISPLPSPCAYNTEIKKGKDLKVGDKYKTGEMRINQDYLIADEEVTYRYNHNLINAELLVQVYPTEQKPLTEMLSFEDYVKKHTNEGAYDLSKKEDRDKAYPLYIGYLTAFKK